MNTSRTITVALAVAFGALAFGDDIQVKVNGNLVSFPDQQPVLQGDLCMVPIRGVFEKMGAKVEWQPGVNGVTIDNGTTQIRLFVYDRLAHVGDREVYLDSNPVLMNDRVLVPARFLGDAASAQVEWDSSAQLVSIQTGVISAEASRQPVTEVRAGDYTSQILAQGTVLPMKLLTPLNSGSATAQETFTCVIDTGEAFDYGGLPRGTIIRGHVVSVRAMTPAAPGVLELAFDTIKLPDGTTYPVLASAISPDDKSITTVNGRQVASIPTSTDLKFVGYGPGMLVPLPTPGSSLTDITITNALMSMQGVAQLDSKQYHEVDLTMDMPIDMRLNSDFAFKSPTTP